MFYNDIDKLLKPLFYLVLISLILLALMSNHCTEKEITKNVQDIRLSKSIWIDKYIITTEDGKKYSLSNTEMDMYLIRSDTNNITISYYIDEETGNVTKIGLTDEVINELGIKNIPLE